MSYQLKAIGTIHSCFKEKFGIPRQPGLVTEAEATLELLPPYNQPDALQGLEGYSHLWISFIFHQSMDTPWRPMVRPPRLGGNKKVGVFATRSPIRPNPMGLSVVELISVEQEACRVHLKGVDLLDGTPVLDIKPYLPYVDAITDAKGGFAPQPPNQNRIEVTFEEQALQTLSKIAGKNMPQMMRLIQQLIEQDPRPAYMKNDTEPREFGMHLYNFNLRWQMRGQQAVIFEIKQVDK